LIRTIQEFFYARIVSTSEQATPADITIPQEKRIQLATAALLIEVSRADNQVRNHELDAIEDSIASSFGLTKDETEEIVALAQRQVEESISLYEFTRLIDRSFSPEQKKHIVGLLWDVAFSDARLEENEEYLIRKAAKLLHVAHADFIEEKLRARERRSKKTQT
jgi:uncharacterized tellurite resistance protein B-like protein